MARNLKLDPGERVRRICLALPGTWEKLSHGEPTWFVDKKVFAMFSNNHHQDGHIAVVVPAAIGVQEMLIKKSPTKFYRPPYVGVRGWIGIEVNRDRIDARSLRALLQRSTLVEGIAHDRKRIPGTMFNPDVGCSNDQNRRGSTADGWRGG